jgi:hypothetical protein
MELADHAADVRDVVEHMAGRQIKTPIAER